jgi:hypothetical protein
MSEPLWYPPRAEFLPSAEGLTKVEKEVNRPCNDHEIFTSGAVRFTPCNVWPKSLPKAHKQNCRRERLHGVEIRDLPRNHLLYGQQGLFATKRWFQFDVIGEYTGEVAPKSASGEYVACLEDKTHADSLGLNAEFVGNESRFINSYLNVEHLPNVAMKTVYIDTYPRIIIIVTKLIIEPGDEILLDYGQAYTDAFFTKPEAVAEDAGGCQGAADADVDPDLTTNGLVKALSLGDDFEAKERRALRALPKFMRPDGVYSSSSSDSDSDSD